MTITLGWWAVPLAVTLVACGGVILWEHRQPPPSGYGHIGAGLVTLIMFGAATIVSLIAWLVWAVLT